jgi:CBS domain-containing protein
MKVQDAMRSMVISCRPETNLAEAVDLLWSCDCGVLPVVDAANKVVAIITDRDICVAVGSRNRPPADILVKHVASSEVFTCKGNDDIHFALDIMRDNQIRRLPVVNEVGILKGILSLNDIILCAAPIGGKKAAELTDSDVMPVLKAICQRHALPLQKRVTAAA